MTIFVKPSAEVELDHRAYHFSGLLGRSGIAVASEEGYITVIGPDLKKHITFKRLEKTQDLSLHPSKPLLAIVEGKDRQLNLVDLNNLSTQVSYSPKKDENWTPNQGPSGTCLFNLDGRYLWYATAYSDAEVAIRLLECDTWRIINSIIIEDPYRESRLFFHSIGSPEKVVLWLASGQDGQQVYWLRADGNRIVVETEPYLEDTTPPAFSPDGKEFLVIRDSMALCKYQFPDTETVKEYQWPEFENSLCYISQERAMANSSAGRLFIFDLKEMAVVGEVWIENHEPKPTSVYYPSLTDDTDLCTDITYFECFGDILVFIFRRDHNVGSLPWEDTLLFLPVAALARPNGIGC